MGIDNLMNNIQGLSFSEIKSSMNIIMSDIDDERAIMLEKVYEVLKCDKRKNVISLGDRAKRKLDEYRCELLRVKNLYEFDRGFGDYKYICGVDEVGRGPLAGPIVAAAVVLDLNFINNSDLILYINDSKKLSEPLRDRLSKIIKEKALAYSIIAFDNNEIDNKGIAFCNNEALKLASTRLSIKPELVLSDGYPIKNLNIKNEFVIKGDAKSASIACASIIAKVYRDNLMKEYDSVYPQYGFAKHVGYGTKEHIQNIKDHGITSIHRKSFLTNFL